MSTTFILVADRGRARILAADTETARLVEVGCFANPDARRPARELERARRPRVSESVGPRRHAIEPTTTLADKVSRRFARLLVGALREAHGTHHFERLLLVAPSKFLGVLNAALTKDLRGVLADELALDLSTRSLEELPGRLPKSWLGPASVKMRSASRVGRRAGRAGRTSKSDEPRNHA